MVPLPVASPRIGVFFGIGTTLAILAILSVWSPGPLMSRLAGQFRCDDPAPADAMMVLVGGWKNRPQKAAALFQQGMAPLIVVSASDPLPYPDLCDSALNCRVLRHLGVPEDRIVVLPKVSTSTREEALQMREYAASRRFRRIVVVTTAFHTARARWIFDRVFKGTGVEIRTAAAEDPRFNDSNWFSNSGLLVYLQEAAKRLVYQVVY